MILADLSLRSEAEELVAKHQTGSPRAIFQKTDVTDWTQLSRLFDLAISEFGSVNIVCPGAGIYESDFSSFWIEPGTQSSRDFVERGRYAQVDINLTHPIRMAQLAIECFVRSGQSATAVSTDGTKSNGVPPHRLKSIVLISSTAGQLTPVVAPIYNATKHAINGFTRSLGALEARSGIRVAAVAPAVVKTPLWTHDPVNAAAVVEGVDEWVTPQEVADVMFQLATRNSLKAKKIVDASSGGKADVDDIPIAGGTILEVTRNYVREVKAFNDPGPQRRPGSTVSNMGALEGRMRKFLSLPQ